MHGLGSTALCYPAAAGHAWQACRSTQSSFHWHACLFTASRAVTQSHGMLGHPAASNQRQELAERHLTVMPGWDDALISLPWTADIAAAAAAAAAGSAKTCPANTGSMPCLHPLGPSEVIVGKQQPCAPEIQSCCLHRIAWHGMARHGIKEQRCDGRRVKLLPLINVTVGTCPLIRHGQASWLSPFRRHQQQSVPFLWQ